MNIRYKIVKVRVNHKCFSCLKTINAGDIAEMHTNIYDGSIYNLYICGNCINFINKNCNSCMECECDGYNEGYISDCDIYKNENIVNEYKKKMDIKLKNIDK